MSVEQNKFIDNKNESYDTIVIGGGQAGLASGYFLAQLNQDFIIIDKNLQIGEVWRNRWDSLHLFTPSQFDGLPGMPFPKPDNYFPSKDEVADYLQEYARRFSLQVRHRIKVDALKYNDQTYHITAGDTHFVARNVIVATGAFRIPHKPSFVTELDSSVIQLHSSDYCNPDQIPVQAVLVVGAGNSGAEIALELARAGKQVWLAGRDVGHIPADKLGMAFNGRPWWWFMNKILSVNTPIGRKMKGRVTHHGNPLIHVRRQDIVEAGGIITGRVSGVENGKPRIEDGRILAVAGVIWATGYQPDFSWINLPVFDEYGYPRHKHGIVQESPGLYFVGLHFQTSLSSDLLGGVGADAGYIVRQIARNSLP
jgi:putative flavoprotein involved in K+ transport